MIKKRHWVKSLKRNSRTPEQFVTVNADGLPTEIFAKLKIARPPYNSYLTILS